MIGSLWWAMISMYSPSYPRVLAYMLQSSEYQVRPYIAWVNRTRDFKTVMRRRSLRLTVSSRLVLHALQVGMGLQVALGAVLVYLGAIGHLIGGVYFGIAIIVIYPLLWPYAIALAIFIAHYAVVVPQQKQRIIASEQIFKKHPGSIVAVAGSFGKTTMKELLLCVLSEGLDVCATPANKNVASSHALFSKTLSGSEDVVIIEYGEGAPGDVDRFARTTHPTHAIITGLAPAHLDQYKTLKAAGDDIFSLAHYVDHKQLYVDDSATATHDFITPDMQVFNRRGSLGWKVASARVALQGTDFSLTKGKQTIELHSGLIGRHQLGFLSFVASFGLSLGLSKDQVRSGIAKTMPFEHRMQPYQLGGAWIIDDTYNGNIEGIRAGTELLAELPAQRKLYVTPGLVDQGKESEAVHLEVGRLIADSKADIVILMENSVTGYIKAGLQAAKYDGEIRIEQMPLDFYLNLKHFVASGDLVMMQNDWTDNYA